MKRGNIDHDQNSHVLPAGQQLSRWGFSYISSGFQWSFEINTYASKIFQVCMCVVVFYFNKCNLLEQFFKMFLCSIAQDSKKNEISLWVKKKIKWNGIKDNCGIHESFIILLTENVCMRVLTGFRTHFGRRLQRLDWENPAVHVWLCFSPAFVVLVTTNRKTGSVRRLSWERKLLRLLCRPQNDWVLGLFQLLHCRAATAGESAISMDVRSVNLAFCTAAVFDVNVGVKPVFRLFPLYSQSC